MSYLVSTLNSSSESEALSTRSSPALAFALDLLAVLISDNMSIKYPSDIKLEVDNKTIAGYGALSVVEVGKLAPDGKLIAIKRNRCLSKQLPQDTEEAFHSHITQLNLELRILGHESIRHHPNVVGSLGVLLAGDDDLPQISCIFEYSSYGDLRSFLICHEATLTNLDLVHFSLQVARGLEALHMLKICHGDVKAENVLVFSENDHWCLKLTDFGSSVVICRDQTAGRKGFPLGTPTYNAPEIRKEIVYDDSRFTIGDAILTDVYSFGLLFWEILKRGKRYTEDVQPLNDNIVILESKTTINSLRELATDSLLARAIDSASKMALDPTILTRAEYIFKGCLRDCPPRRTSMPILSRVLDMNEPLTSSYERLSATEEEEEEEEDVAVFELASPTWWSKDKSFYDIRRGFYGKGYLVGALPRVIREMAAFQCEAIFNFENFSIDTRAHAAMTLSEFYSVGFVGNREPAKIIEWLEKSASLQDGRARKWHDRVRYALGIPSTGPTPQVFKDLERDAIDLPSEKYLTSRIRSFNTFRLKEARQEYELSTQTSNGTQTDLLFKATIFTSWNQDRLSELHIASWAGDDSKVRRLLQDVPVNVQSSLGLTSLHYACLGGNLSTMRLLISRDALVEVDSPVNLSPLHLCMHFGENDLYTAVNDLLDHGACPFRQTTESLVWEDHDLILRGSPLDWAVLTRNQALVELLLPYAQGSSALQNAISHFFWEIAEVIIQHFDRFDSFWNSQIDHRVDGLWSPQIEFVALSRPFFHWIAHGADHVEAITKTVSVCTRYRSPYGDPEESCSSLMGQICHSKIAVPPDGWTFNLSKLMDPLLARDDFETMREIISCFTRAQIKILDSYGYNYLTRALGISKRDNSWLRIIYWLMAHYDVRELEAEAIPGSGLPYLHLAVICNSLVGVSALLERGVNINQLDSCGGFTALHYCGRNQSSIAMYNLLVSHSPKTDIQEQTTNQRPLALQLFATSINKSFLAHTLGSIDKKSDESGIVFKMFYYSMSKEIKLLKGDDRTPRDFSIQFAHLLTWPHLRNHINNPLHSDSGMTMLHSAALHLNYDIVSLLLEAGADAEIPVELEQCGITLYPLQIAMVVGRATWRCRLSEDERRFVSGQRGNALRVATKLLQWHQAKGGELFRGLTSLHLASFMRIEGEIQGLKASCDTDESLGHWPVRDHKVTPSDLRNPKWDKKCLSILPEINDLEQQFVESRILY